MVKSIKLVVFALMGLMFFAAVQPALAEEFEEGVNIIVTPNAFKYLANTSCYYALEENYITVNGSTQTYSTVDKIITTVYLEKKTSSDWSTVKSWPGTATNSNICKASGKYTGESDCTYRVRCTHQAMKGSLTENNTSYSASFSLD